MSATLVGRTAVITGAGRGIGRAIALGLAREGARVALIARTRSELESAAEEVRKAGGQAMVVTGDVSRSEDVEACFAAVGRELGAVDILVNAAGTFQLMAFATSNEADWWRQIEVNLRSAYLCSRAVVPGMVQRSWGRIINIASLAAKIGFPQNTAYCASKHGLLGLTRALALELATTGVTVNAVCPGFVQTQLLEGVIAQRATMSGMSAEQVTRGMVERSPQRVLLEPGEIVPAVLFLVSEGAIRTTGEALNVSSGVVMH